MGATSWVNSQIARYTLADDEQVIQKLASEGETVAALIVYGYEDGHLAPSP